MYKEYRNVSRTLAVESLYQDMAARHRARFRSIHVDPSNARPDSGYPSRGNPENGGRQASVY
jgi:Ribosomal proteins 50S-L18Ae/60S-L20/60S-L18A